MHQYKVSLLSLDKTNDVVWSYLNCLVAMRRESSKHWQESEASLSEVVENSITKFFAVLILTTCYQNFFVIEGNDKSVAPWYHMLPSKIHWWPGLRHRAIYVLFSIESLDAFQVLFVTWWCIKSTENIDHVFISGRAVLLANLSQRPCHWPFACWDVVFLALRPMHFGVRREYTSGQEDELVKECD